MGIESPTRPYAFARIFDQTSVDAQRSSEDLALQLLALQSELASQRERAGTELARARAEGFAAGLEHARSDATANLLMAQHALVAGITRLENAYLATEIRVAGVAAEAALAAAELLAACELENRPCAAIDAAIGRVLGQIGFREALHIHVHPDLVEPLAALIDQRGTLAQRPLSLVLHADPALPPGDAHILWDSGGLSLDAAARRMAVCDALGLSSDGSRVESASAGVAA